MTFPFNYYLAAFVGALIITFSVLPFWRKWCLQTNLVDDPRDGKNYDAPKIHTGAMPLAGGLAVLSGILATLVAGMFFSAASVNNPTFLPPIAYGFDRRGTELLAIALGAVGITALGLLDDKSELKPLPKFAGQFVIALLVAAAGVRITLFVPNIFFSYSITVLWIVTVINAFNFSDNMNGLCAGLGAIGALLFAAIAAVNGDYLVALMGFSMGGALIGFLPWNFPVARAFLGDSGSHLTGYLLAVMAILPHFYNKLNPHPLAVLSPLLVLAVPLVDLAQVVILRTLNRRAFWIGDTNHLSHRLVRAGLNRERAVMVLWLAAVTIGVIALL
ncbi:MAG TPA: MraY family glycosyltransferase [Verrucomicrobiae bacterium]|nr:MraY family glycosyltransferase [Verrucomicrobiae bacterium]